MGSTRQAVASDRSSHVREKNAWNSRRFAVSGEHTRPRVQYAASRRKYRVRRAADRHMRDTYASRTYQQPSAICLER